jgi:starch synthase (maltosyl-transferring)
MKPQKMFVYNLFPQLAGKFKDWDSHLARASKMGFNWVFVNPIQLPGMSGSIYAIKDYFRFNPLLLDEGIDPMEQAKRAIRQAEKGGLKMMVDLVINHCAVDSKLLEEHPEWFLWESKGKVAHPFADQDGKKVVWGDLARFDHRNTKDKEGLYQFFLSIVRFMVELGFKGFRCDAAYQLPRSLWERLIREAKASDPDLLFFAETLGCTPELTRKTARAGFDFIFNSSKWWDFKSRWLMQQYSLTRDTVPSIGFPESHDTLRLCEELNGNVDGIMQRWLFTALFATGVMIPMGFEFGFRKKLHVVNTRPEDWEETPIDLTGFITEVLQIKEAHELFQSEVPTEMIHHDNPNVLLMWKASADSAEEALLILNKDIHNRQPFYAENLQDFFESRSPLTDISPGSRLEYVSTPFSYELRPGQGLLLKTQREVIEDD